MKKGKFGLIGRILEMRKRGLGLEIWNEWFWMAYMQNLENEFLEELHAF